MSRSVGGAGAVGCGAFGLVGVLISVGLVVWLGSMALDGSTGDGSDADTPRATTTTTGAALPASATIALAPADGHVDGRPISITGSGFAPGPVVITQCLTHAPGPLSDRCAAGTDVSVEAAASGAWTVAFVTHRSITVDDTTYDCAASPGACSVVAHLPEGTDGASAPLAFATDLAPIDATAPPTG